MSDLTLIERRHSDRLLIKVESVAGKKWVDKNIATDGYKTTTVIEITADHSDIEELIAKMKADNVDVEVL